MKYDVDIQVGISGIAYVTRTVEADNEDEAKEKAKDEGVLISELEDVHVEEIHRPFYADSVQESDAA